MRILGLETSCDETSWAVLDVTRPRLNLRGFTVSSQVKLHAKWGGVVPELAARRHTEQIIPLLQATLQQAHTTPAELNLITVTQGPGLITALQVGVETAKALAAIWRKPIVGVNHIAGHLVSPFLSAGAWPLATSKKTWPAVALVVSGGHTELYLMKSIISWRLLGRTRDDAAGEAFDKVGKMLRLPYPGGPQVAKLALGGNREAFQFPRPMVKSKDYNFSFAGLKTAVLYSLPQQTAIGQQLKADVCASLQQAAVDVLVAKTVQAARAMNARSVILAGGVSANRALRKQLAHALKSLHPTPYTLLPELRFTGDNAAMIALAAGVQILSTKKQPTTKIWHQLQADANWELWR